MQEKKEASENRVSSYTEILPIINRLSIFHSFSDDEKRQMVSEDAHFRVYSSGEMLIRKGCSDSSLFILLAGTVSITDGTGETVIAVLRAGDIFGEMAFLTDTRRTANVIARESVIALKLDRLLFDRLSPEIREKFKDRIIEKLVARLNLSNKELARMDTRAQPKPSRSSKPKKPASDPVENRATSQEFVSGRKLIRKILSQTSSLPVMPEVMVKVQQKIKLPGAGPLQLAKIIETDPAIVAGILKVANSAYYGFRGKVTTIQHASSLFGTRRLADLITAMSAGGMLGKAMDGYGLKAGDMWRHSIAVACTAGEIASIVAPEVADSAYMAGLLHDVGKLILDPYVKERKILFDHYYAKNPEKPVQEAEYDIFGFDHAVIASILCENWNLPRNISFGIRHHHQPSLAGEHPLTHIVHLADNATVQAGVKGSGYPGNQVLDESSHSMIPIDQDTLHALAEKACRYMESLTEHLLSS